ncbi:hypothetical protein RirG_011380 [Rhizophagus irregularis DAOM 197198w]|uniref:Uncharacterized protein n=1 Tax=Rhizophagus irregularis (strain DAOM 197198w) TaxID=1432141 RepID=A0A015LGN7_RHIIW|nr:hypothetical protein RirG_011380 [Rhizophagus irregularis DAOM 197198w]
MRRVETWSVYENEQKAGDRHDVRGSAARLDSTGNREMTGCTKISNILYSFLDQLQPPRSGHGVRGPKPGENSTRVTWTAAPTRHTSRCIGQEREKNPRHLDAFLRMEKAFCLIQAHGNKSVKGREQHCLSGTCRR